MAAGKSLNCSLILGDFAPQKTNFSPLFHSMVGLGITGWGGATKQCKEGGGGVRKKWQTVTREGGRKGGESKSFFSVAYGPLGQKRRKMLYSIFGFWEGKLDFRREGGGRVLSIVREGRKGILIICCTFVIKVTIDYLAKYVKNSRYYRRVLRKKATFGRGGWGVLSF